MDILGPQVTHWSLHSISHMTVTWYAEGGYNRNEHELVWYLLQILFHMSLVLQYINVS